MFPETNAWQHVDDSHVHAELACRSRSCNHCDAKQTHLQPVAVRDPVHPFITRARGDAIKDELTTVPSGAGPVPRGLNSLSFDVFWVPLCSNSFLFSF